MCNGKSHDAKVRENSQTVGTASPNKCISLGQSEKYSVCVEFPGLLHGSRVNTMLLALPGWILLSDMLQPRVWRKRGSYPF